MLLTNYIHSLLTPFMCFTTNQFAKKFEFLANLTTYFVNMCNISSKSLSKSVKWSLRPFPKEQPEKGGEIYARSHLISL